MTAAATFFREIRAWRRLRVGELARVALQPERGGHEVSILKQIVNAD
jgi:hypothetical protein